MTRCVTVLVAGSMITRITLPGPSTQLAPAPIANPVRAGTVIAQNSPPGTIEPAGSPVDLTISLGAVTIPDLEGDTAAQAISELTAVGLAAHIEHRAQCVDPGLVIDQTPSAGTSVVPGSTVTITIDSGPLHSC